MTDSDDLTGNDSDDSLSKLRPEAPCFVPPPCAPPNERRPSLTLKVKPPDLQIFDTVPFTPSQGICTPSPANPDTVYQYQYQHHAEGVEQLIDSGASPDSALPSGLALQQKQLPPYFHASMLLPGGMPPRPHGGRGMKGGRGMGGMQQDWYRGGGYDRQPPFPPLPASAPPPNWYVPNAGLQPGAGELHAQPPHDPSPNWFLQRAGRGGGTNGRGPGPSAMARSSVSAPWSSRPSSQQKQQQQQQQQQSQQRLLQQQQQQQERAAYYSKIEEELGLQHEELMKMNARQRRHALRRRIREMKESENSEDGDSTGEIRDASSLGAEGFFDDDPAKSSSPEISLQGDDEREAPSGAEQLTQEQLSELSLSEDP
ncbi:hypothetical protein CYMTET_21467 [Cymbomonas tetramitiformis]|uniref:Uncharacterized protein n=1 Tax=Cymbomonas tetramitiformis TaxID=36881 RepID=A0AAE0G1V5_9CHLO|nr:hypothetical protein CYMTET_21467 [Cymbomonas tetramitiformis]